MRSVKRAFDPVHLNPENKTFSEIMGNNKIYRVPAFQRDYSWKQEQISELWQDVENMRKHRTQHFMGYLVLQSQDGKAFEVIDGQQRLTTISLMIIATLSRFKELIGQQQETEKNRQRLDHYHKTYLGVFDAMTLETSLKLTLNYNNRRHFSEIINSPYGVPKMRGVTSSNRNLNKALEFFNKELASFDGGHLVEFISDIADGLLFTTITVRDDLDAYLVFETLNARGVHLSVPDLLKNHLQSALATRLEPQNSAFQIFNGHWGAILDQLGATNFTDFLRSYHGMLGKLLPKRELYRVLRREIDRSEQVMPYLQEIKRHAPIYAALQNPPDSFWRDYGDGQYLDCVEDLETLRIFYIKTPLSLLMAAYDKFSPQDFVKIVRWIAIISIRYNVICGKVANEQEATYNRLANRIMKDAHKGQFHLSDLKAGLLSVYPKDQEFVSAFAVKSIPGGGQSAKRARHLLQKIEAYLAGEAKMPATLTLEHILPDNPESAWQESFGLESYNEAIDRLGNMALLPENQNLAQEPFDKKRELLAASSCIINREIGKYQSWNIESLNQRQMWLAHQAKTVWRIG